MSPQDQKQNRQNYKLTLNKYLYIGICYRQMIDKKKKEGIIKKEKGNQIAFVLTVGYNC